MKFTQWPKLRINKRVLIFRVVFVALMLNIIFSISLIYYLQNQYLKNSLLSKSQLAISLLSNDIAEGNYRRVIEQLSTKEIASEGKITSIAFYDLISKSIITSSRTHGIKKVCEKSSFNSQHISENYFEYLCLPINSGLMIQIEFDVDYSKIYNIPLLWFSLLFNFIFAITLTILTITGLNQYLNYFLYLLNNLLDKKDIDKNISKEFMPSLTAIKKISVTLDQLKATIAEKAKDEAFFDLSKKVLHNIRTPINSIGLTIPLLKNGLDHETEEILRTSLTEIEDSVENALNHYRNNKNVPNKGNLYQLVSESIAEIKFQNKDNPKLSFEFESDLFSRSYEKDVNHIDFKAAIKNILNNSIEAMPQGGTISTSIAQINDSNIKITISDEGTGFHQNIIHKIGTKGFSYNKRNGIGLGLYSSSHDISSWGGTIIYKNRIDRHGATVTIMI